MFLLSVISKTQMMKTPLNHIPESEFGAKVFLEQPHAEYQEQGLAHNLSICWNHSKENSTQSRKMAKKKNSFY